MKSRRGISEMVAVILVLIIVSVAGAALYRTSLVTLSSQFTTYTQQTKDQILAAEERFEVVNVEKDALDSSHVKIYLLNYSPEKTIDVTVDKVYIEDTPSTWTPIATGPNPGLLSKNIVTPIEVFSNTGFTPGNVYNFVIVSQRGAENAYTWKCPE